MRRIAFVFFVALLASGCSSRRYMAADFGDSNRAFLAVQRIPPKPHTNAAVLGLDPDEAQLVFDAYQKSLGGKASGGKGNPMLQVSGEKNGK